MGFCPPLDWVIDAEVAFMKRDELLRTLRRIARLNHVEFAFVREGKKHEIWSFDGLHISVPRHRDVERFTAEGLIKECTAKAKGLQQ